MNVMACGFPARSLTFTHNDYDCFFFSYKEYQNTIMPKMPPFALVSDEPDLSIYSYTEQILCLTVYI